MTEESNLEKIDNKDKQKRIIEIEDSFKKNSNNFFKKQLFVIISWVITTLVICMIPILLFPSLENDNFFGTIFILFFIISFVFLFKFLFKIEKTNHEKVTNELSELDKALLEEKKITAEQKRIAENMNNKNTDDSPCIVLLFYIGLFLLVIFLIVKFIKFVWFM